MIATAIRNFRQAA